MLKPIVAAVLVVALSGTASAAGWRSLRLDARDEASFTQSVGAFQEELSPERWYAFRVALQDIWYQGARSAAADQREYTAADYLRQLDGLGYEQVVRFTDPTGNTARRNAAAYDGELTSPTNSPPRSDPRPRSSQGPQYVPRGGGEQLHGDPDRMPQRP